MVNRANFRHVFTGPLPILFGILAIGGLLLSAQPVAAQNCIQDVWQAHGNKQGLNCTANDVQLSQVTNIDISSGGYCETVDGVKTCYCYEGQDVTFTADFYMLLTAQDRYDIGFYIATDADATTYGALTGQCVATNVTNSNSPTFYNPDPAPDACGDIVGPMDTAYNPQIVHFTVTMPCIPDANGKLALPYCTTWRQPGSNEICLGVTSNPATNDVYPGSPSKCFCELKEIDIFTETASIEVTKENVSGNVPETGGSVTYNVTVENLAQISSVTLDSLVDNLYGDITTTGHDGITATTCTTATIPAGNVTGNPYTCQFTVDVPPGDSGQVVTDIVTVCGSDEFGHSNLCDDDPANFTYLDVQQPPTLVKTAVASSNVTFSVDVTYTVVVNNTSAVPPGDTLMLNSLTDNRFGDITTVHAAGGGYEQVVSTTCGQSPGPGELPVLIPPGSNYSCQFVGRISSSPHVNTSTASATDDDDVTYTPSDDATVNVTVSVTFL